MANNSFARSVLEKYGWKTGAGLGKDEHGIPEPIKVSLKSTKSGLGHIPGSELTRNWWDQMYNDAAKKISQNTNKSQNLKQEIKTECSSKNLLYGNFLQGSTQHSTDAGIVEETISELLPEGSQNFPPKLTDEQLFEICGRRTAHKAARHGLQLNGKMQRIKKQEQRYLELLESAKNHKNQPSNIKPSSIYKTLTETGCEKQQKCIDSNNCLEQETLIKRKKKKKKKKDYLNSEVDLEKTVHCQQSLETQELVRNKLYVNEDLKDTSKNIVQLSKQNRNVITEHTQRSKQKVKKHKKRKRCIEFE